MIRSYSSGDPVTVRGDHYRIAEIRPAGSAGAKWAGKFVFILVDGNGARFRALGKKLAHNSRLTPDR